MPVQTKPPIATVKRERIYVSSPYELKDVCKSISGATWDAMERAWSYPASSAPRVAEALRPYGLQATESYKAMLEQQEQAQNMKNADDLPEIPCTKTKAWKHQLQSFWFVVNLWGGLPEE